MSTSSNFQYNKTENSQISVDEPVVQTIPSTSRQTEPTHLSHNDLVVKDEDDTPQAQDDHDETWRVYYHITLMVSSEQEGAIIDLFKDRHWSYVKLDNLEIDGKSNGKDKDQTQSKDVSRGQGKTTTFSNNIYCKDCEHTCKKTGWCKKHLKGDRMMQDANDVDLNDSLPETPMPAEMHVTEPIEALDSVVHEAVDGSFLEDSVLEDGTSGVTFKCDSCRKTFKKMTTLDKHIREHQGTDISCKSCKITFYRKEDLTTHNGLHHRHVCDLCGAVFRTQFNVREHKQNVHKTNENVKKFSCDDCGQIFTRLVHLQDHKNVQHTGEKPHCCGKCGKAFGRKRSYQEHYKHCRDTTEKLKCSFCDKEFVHKGSLKHHTEALHERQKYECKKCSKTFKYRPNLARHSKVCEPR